MTGTDALSWGDTHAFTSYYVTKNIPTSITVPCSGSGTAVFTPLPHSKTAKSATLPLTFENVGV